MINLLVELVCAVYDITEAELRSDPDLEAQALLYKLCIAAKINRKRKEAVSSEIFHTDSFLRKYKQCQPLLRHIVSIYKKKPSTVYTKAEEIRMVRAMISSYRFMKRYIQI